jgi:hypothetical protein
MIYIYIYIFNRNWVDTRWQQYITHLHTNNTQNTQKGEFGKCGSCPVFASYTLAFALQLRKKHGKPSVRVAQCKNNEQAQYKNNGTHFHVMPRLKTSGPIPLLRDTPLRRAQRQLSVCVVLMMIKVTTAYKPCFFFNYNIENICCRLEYVCRIVSKILSCILFRVGTGLIERRSLFQ